MIATRMKVEIQCLNVQEQNIYVKRITIIFVRI